MCNCLAILLYPGMAHRNHFMFVQQPILSKIWLQVCQALQNINAYKVIPYLKWIMSINVFSFHESFIICLCALQAVS